MEIALMIAEKPSVAKAIAEFLGSGVQSRKYIGKSKFNPIYEFPYTLNSGQHLLLKITSVLGHIMSIDFSEAERQWGSINDIEKLFTAPISKFAADS